MILALKKLDKVKNFKKQTIIKAFNIVFFSIIKILIPLINIFN